MISPTDDYNWHPAIHVDYDETLYFVLLRLKKPLHQPISDQVRDLLDRADIRFACEYSIFGYWDALIRVWLTHGGYERLYRLLGQMHARDDVVFETFAASEIRYLWNESNPGNLLGDVSVRKALLTHKRDIDTAVKTPEALDAAKWTELKDAHLVIPRREVISDPEHIKFYIALERVGSDVPAHGELDAVLSAIAECDVLDFTSLYVGKAWFAAYLIRCVSPTYRGVLDFSKLLDIKLRHTPLRPMTLLIANLDALESDRVNDSRSLSRRAEQTLELLGVENNPATFTNLNSHDWDALAELVESAHQLAGDDESTLRRMLAILRACMKDDHDELASALAFLPDSESFLAEYAVRSWALTIGNHWFNELKRQFSSGGSDLQRSADEIQKPKDKWTAGSYAHFAVNTASFHSLFDARLKRELSVDWKAQMLSYADLRNHPAHGKLRALGHVDTFRQAPLRSLLDELLDVTALCSRFRRFAEEYARQNGQAPGDAA